MTTRRPLARALAWLAFLGPFFFASYGFANWLASRRADVPAIVFAWERSIPFVPWTIIPYWSIDLLYGLSLLVCATRRELDRHAQRLLTVQIVAVACFIAFPLRFSFDRPPADGIFGALFAALGSFDRPFNQAPSLHIALLVVIWFTLSRHVAPRWRWLLHGWMTLIGVSVLTTYQHHFIDIPTGLALGFAALWALPDGAPSPLSGLALSTDRRRRRLAAAYALGALAIGAPAAAGGAWLWLLWPAVSLALVALNYAAVGARGFQKGADGRLSAGAWGLFAPYLAAAWVNSRLWTRKHPQPAEVGDGVWIGRVPYRPSFPAVIDLSAEVPLASAGLRFHRSLPVLDLTVAPEERLREAAAAIEEARAHGPVLVCCALGYSRSASAVVAWLLTTGRASSVEEAALRVRQARPSIVLRRDHREALGALA